MNVWIIISIVAVVILIITLIGVLVWKMTGKKKNQLGKLPKITKQGTPLRVQSVLGTGMNGGYAQPKPPVTGNVQSDYANRVQNRYINEDATVAMEYEAGRSAFLVDRLHKTQLIIMKPSIIIGTDKNKADFIIRDSRTVSRQHAVLYIKDLHYYVTDNHSTNHTYVNEIILKPGEVREIHSGDMIRVADVNLEFIVK